MLPATVCVERLNSKTSGIIERAGNNCESGQSLSKAHVVCKYAIARLCWLCGSLVGHYVLIAGMCKLQFLALVESDPVLRQCIVSDNDTMPELAHVLQQSFLTLEHEVLRLKLMSVEFDKRHRFEDEGNAYSISGTVRCVLSASELRTW